jgi:hypothetical protein
MTRTALALSLLLGAAACIPEEGPLMEPGSNCLECHDGGDARRWTVAGTWPGGQGRHVVVRDAAGRSLTIRTNRAGNFYTAEPLAFPLTSVAVDGGEMPRPPVTQPQAFSQGSCNLCHGSGGAGD